MAVRVEKRVVEQTEKIYTCNICGNEVPYVNKCMICESDMCRECQYPGRYSEIMRWKHEPDTDYPAIYCKLCWGVGEQFRDQYSKVKVQRLEEMGEELDGIIVLWREAARNRV